MNYLLKIKSNTIRRPKITILGSGWAGYGIAKNLDKKLFDVTMVSPRNHFLFTPLLTTTTVGTLEFRNITEPVRLIKGIEFYQASCKSIDHEKNQITCVSDFNPSNKFNLNYDVLVVACGATSNTFGIKGVEENCHFLKQVSDAQKIRKQISELFEKTNYPNMSDKEKRKLLTFSIVGAGPASIEFAAELYDFLKQDAFKAYPHLINYIQIYLIEALPEILMNFKPEMRKYTHNLYENRKIKILTNVAVKEVVDKTVILSNGKKIDSGIIVWNTGNKQIPFVNHLNFDKGKRCKRLITDEFNRVMKNNKPIENVVAMGDCSFNPENPLPPTAQVANQQANWFWKLANKAKSENDLKPFKYVHRGTLAYIGDRKALAQTDFITAKGLTGWAIWNVAYLRQQFTLKNKIQVPLNWGCSFLFGRNISRF